MSSKNKQQPIKKTIKQEVEQEPDSELITEDDTLSKLTVKVLGQIDYSVALILLLVIILVQSDYFVDNVLAKISNATQGRYASNKGTMIQAFTIVVVYIVVDLLSKNNLL